MGFAPTKSFPFTQAVHQVSDHCYAWLQPGGGFCLSNAGLVSAGDSALLVDTLIDLPRTRAMIAAFEAAATGGRPIDALLNTHSHPDHTAGNAAMSGRSIYMTPVCAKEAAPIEHMIRMMDTLTGDALALMHELGVDKFSTEGVVFVPPTQTFEGELTLDIGGLTVDVVEVGAAHSGSDSIIHIRSDGVVIAGDMLFEGGHPVLGAPSVGNWHKALDLMIGWGADTFVPGHGRICGREEVWRHRDYLLFVEGQIRRRFDRGMEPEACALDVFEHLARYSGLYRADNLLRNVNAFYARFRGEDAVHGSFPQHMAERYRFRNKIRGRAPGILVDHTPDGN